MKIAIDILRQYVDLPQDARTIRDLFDDLGLEVKRQETGEDGLSFTLELLANRGDHHCYAGLAREISGRTGDEVTFPPFAKLDVSPGESARRALRPVQILVETPLCLVYTATLLERVGEPESLAPHYLRTLQVAGLKPISAPVDATNLANLEFGQPTHAFDADRIDGPITIRTSRAGERAWPLFAPEPIEVPEGTLVIADATKILAIAGVIGCEESKTTDQTTRLVLESATFDPVAVRKASRALNLHTDSSARFERGADPTLPLVGAGRVVHLLVEHGWRTAGASVSLGTWTDPNRQIPLEIGQVAGFLEYPFTEEEIRARLSRYGFEVSPPYPDYLGDERWSPPAELADRHRERLRNTLLIRVPPHRLWDVEHEADLSEELAKSIGYNATPSRLPPVDMGALPTPAEVAKSKVEQVLVGNGFYEVFTDGFYGRDLRDAMGVTESHPLWAHVETLNSLDRGYSLLKNNALTQAIEAVASNLRQHRREVRAYEWTRVFVPDASAENGLCSEEKVLWLIACGAVRNPSWAEDPPDFGVHHLKGIVEEIAVELSVPFTLDVTRVGEHRVADLLHPNRRTAIVQGRQVVGVVGEVHPRVCAQFKIKRERPVYLELSSTALLAPPIPVRFSPPSEVQPVERNLAFTLPLGVTAGEIAHHLKTSGPSWLATVEVVDLYEHEEDGRSVRTLTFALTYSRTDAQLTAEEVNQAGEALIRSTETRFGDRGVKLRA